jgi:RNA polymerase sigma factor (sigma-70 family)
VNTQTDPQLLADYSSQGSEDAFAELVRRHLDFVYSAAVRMVCDAQLAGDVTQGVFLALAQNARQLADRPILSGWLHRTTQNLAANAVRSDVRRRAREQEAAAMNDLLVTDPDASWDDIAPQLDAALDELDEPDREALLLRYFERKSAKEMALTLGISDEAAQKRVNRAVERLRELFAKRGVTIGAAGLAVLISANAVQSAPAGLAVAITAASAATATVVATSTAATTAIATTKTIAMTAIQKIVVVVLLAAAVGTGIFEARQNSKLRDQLVTLQQQQAPLAAQVQQLQSDRDDATNRLASLATELARQKNSPNEVLKLRGEVGQLRQEKAIIGEKSALSQVTANPETRKMIRDQQKMGMSAIYANFTKNLKLPPDQADKFNDMLADNIMDNIDLVTQALHDGKSGNDLDQMFSTANAALEQKVQAQLGDDGLAQYQDYTKNLLSTLTAEQFNGMLTGDDAAKAAKTQQLTQLLQQQSQTTLAAAGLPADYQTVPILNFRNIASETDADQDLTLLDNIYAGVESQAGSFLSPDELAKFQQFRTNAISNNRTILTMNRKLMAPISQ